MELDSEKKPSGWGKRHTFALLGFTGFAISYALRFNISIAIVAMVNSSAIGNSNNTQSSSKIDDTCPHDISTNGSKVGQETVMDMSLTSHLEKSFDDQGEFDWNEEMQGYILGSFFWGYILTQLPAGMLTHHFGGKWCFGLGIFIPGVLALLTPVAARMGPGWIMAVRTCQGLGGGVTVPATHGLLAKWIPPAERGTLSPLIYAGMSFGSGITMLVSGYLTHFFGWATVFYATGVAAIIWFLLWSYLTHETPALHPTITQEELKYIGTDESAAENHQTVSPPWKEIWTSVPFWAIMFGHTAETWALYTLMNLMPTYLKTVLHFDMTQNSWVSAFPYLLTWTVSIVISHLGHFLLNKKLASVATVRKLANSIALWGAAICMVGVGYSGCNSLVSVIYLTMAVGILGGFYSGVLCNHIDIAPRFASILMGITNTAATSPGFLAPLSAGYLLKGNPSLEQWRKVFILGAGITFAGNLVFVLFAKGTEQKWNNPTEIESTKKPTLNNKWIRKNIEREPIPKNPA